MLFKFNLGTAATNLHNIRVNVFSPNFYFFLGGGDYRKLKKKITLYCKRIGVFFLLLKALNKTFVNLPFF